MKVFFTIVSMFIGSLAFAGQGGGNGGISVVCRDINNKIISAEILDLFEGRDAYGRTYNDELTTEERMDVIETRTKDRFPDFYYAFTRLVIDIKNNMFFTPQTNEVEPTNDAFPVINKKGCKFEQLALYSEDGTLTVSQEIYQQLDEKNKDALFFHEAVFKIRRKFGDKSSQRSRRLVAHLMANVQDDVLVWSILNHSYLIKEGGYYEYGKIPTTQMSISEVNGKLVMRDDKGNILNFSLIEGVERAYTARLEKTKVHVTFISSVAFYLYYTYPNGQRSSSRQYILRN